MDIWHAMLKEWYWFVIWGALIAVGFAPEFFRAKCPKCKGRHIEAVDLDQKVREEIERREQRAFLTFYRYSGCDTRLFRERTSPYQDATDPRWNLAYDRAFTTVAS
jgi:hypothetical protein